MSLVAFNPRNHPQQPINASVDDRATTHEMFEFVSRRYGPFTLDVAAAAHNAKCHRYFDRASDGLIQPWSGERVWCNPPYSAIAPWVMKAWREYRRCPVILMLLPANRTEQSWWQQLVEPYRDRPLSALTVQFLAGRHRFIAAGSDRVRPNERPPFGCCLLVWKPVTGSPEPEPRLGLFDDEEVCQ